MYHIILTKNKVVNLLPSKPRKYTNEYDHFFKMNISQSKQGEFLFLFWYCLHQISALQSEQKYFLRVHRLVHARMGVRTFLRIYKL